MTKDQDEQCAGMDDMGDYYEELDAKEFEQKAGAGVVQAKIPGAICATA